MIKPCVNRALEFALAKLPRSLLRVCYGWPPVVEAPHKQQSGVLSTVEHSVSFKRHFRRDSRHVDCVCGKSHDLWLVEFHLNFAQSGCKRASRSGLHMFAVRINSNLSKETRGKRCRLWKRGENELQRPVNVCSIVYVMTLNKGLKLVRCWIRWTLF